MRRNLVILGAVTAISLVAAMLGHAYCREFCMLFKPVTWPFIAAGIMVIRSIRAAKHEKGNSERRRP